MKGLGMKGKFNTLCAVVAAVLLLSIVAMAGDPLPDGWMGGNTKDYDIGVDTKIFKEGGVAATIKSKSQSPENFGTIVQTFSAESYLGKRVRMSAYVKADNITSWAGLWMRVDGEGKDEISLSFDNMQSRPIKGTLDWKKYEIVLDIPQKSKSITFGILLDGPGQAWVDDFQFEVVSKDVPVTGMAGYTPRKEPLSLGFE
jgi:hypothetical protein